MGRRLAVLWHLFGDRPAGRTRPGSVVAPVRALLQRLGPVARERPGPLVVTAGDRLDAEETLARLVGAGYRREHQVEHRGEVAVRGGIIDVFPSTADVAGAHRPVGRRGRPAHRLRRRRPALGRPSSTAVVLFGCRELAADGRGPGRGRPSSSAPSPGGAAQWERLAEGQTFDGMESWLPWLQPDDRSSPTCSRPTPRSCWSSPRRVRDRAVELYDEEGALAEALATTWGAPARTATPRGRRRRRAVPPPPPARSTACWPGAGPPPSRCTAVAEGPDVPPSRCGASSRWPATPPGWPRQVTLAGRGRLLGHAVLGHAPAAATRLAACWPRRASRRRWPSAADGAAGVRVVVAAARLGLRAARRPRWRCSSESDVTGRRTPAPPGPAPGPADRRLLRRPRAGQLRGPPPARRGPLRRRDHADRRRHRPATTWCSSTGAATASTCRSTRSRRSPRTAGGESPTLSRDGRGRLAAHPGPGPGGRRRDRRGAGGPLPAPAGRRGPRLRPRHALAAASWSRPSPTSRRPTSSGPSPTSRPTWSSPGRWTAWSAATWASARPRWRSRAVFKAVQDGKQAAVLVPTTLLASQHFQTFADRFAGFPVRVELLSRFLSAAQATQGGRRAGRRLGRRRDRHPPPAGRGRRLQGPRACWWSTRSSASASPTRRRSSGWPRGSTCSP